MATRLNYFQSQLVGGEGEGSEGFSVWPDYSHPCSRALTSSETLGVLVRSLGEPMRPLAEECCQLGLGLCDQVDDPDLRRCT